MSTEGGGRVLAPGVVVVVGVVVAVFAAAVVLVMVRGGGDDTAGSDPGTTAPDVADEHAGHTVACDAVAPSDPAPAPAERERLDTELADAAAVVAATPTVADAEAAGYVAATGPHCSGVHLIRWELMDGELDRGAPEMLLAAGEAPGDPVIGLSFYEIGEGAEPDLFAGALDRFHRHDGMCIRSEDGLVLGQGVAADECAARGGRGGDDGWMLHVWPVPGWENPNGTFAPTTSLLDEQGRRA